jgi:hypothetical protein
MVGGRERQLEREARKVGGEFGQSLRAEASTMRLDRGSNIGSADDDIRDQRLRQAKTEAMIQKERQARGIAEADAPPQESFVQTEARKRRESAASGAFGRGAQQREAGRVAAEEGATAPTGGGFALDSTGGVTIGPPEGGVEAFENLTQPRPQGSVLDALERDLGDDSGPTTDPTPTNQRGASYSPSRQTPTAGASTPAAPEVPAVPAVPGPTGIRGALVSDASRFARSSAERGDAVASAAGRAIIGTGRTLVRAGTGITEGVTSLIPGATGEAIRDLRLPGQARETANAAIDTYRDYARRRLGQVRSVRDALLRHNKRVADVLTRQ